MELNEKGLLPCPFCGGTNLKSGGDDKIVGTWCLTCEAAGPNQYGKHEWNRRATTLPTDVAGLVERLLDISQNDDHVRGCEGRQYTCSCGFDDRTYKTCDEAASTITALSAEVERLGRERDDWKAWRKQHHSDLLTAERDLATAKAALEVKDRALETVGRYADAYDGIPDRKHFGDTDFTMHHPNAEWVNVSLGDLRRARAARAHGGDHAE